MNNDENNDNIFELPNWVRVTITIVLLMWALRIVGISPPKDEFKFGITPSNELEDIVYGLPFHGKVRIDGYLITRVHGGWLYEKDNTTVLIKE